MLRHGIVFVLLLVMAAGCSSMGALSSKNILGSWKGYDDNATTTLTFNSDNTLHIKIESDQSFETTARYAVDYTGKPATIDVVDVKLPDGNVISIAGIIKLEKRELHIRTRNGSSINSIDRPTDFEGDYLILTRVK